MDDIIRQGRIESIDLLRGLVIIIMMVDHVRDFFFAIPTPDPMDLENITHGAFYSRWLAHFCAPIFIFLTGLSAYLHASRKGLTNSQLSSFLIKRGLLLVLLEITLINFAWTFSFPPEKLYLQVIWAIGLSMVCLGIAIWLPRIILVGLALTIICGHNLLDGISFEQGTHAYWIWAILHDRSLLEIGNIAARTSYPVLPWIGLIIAGYLCGNWYQQDTPATERHKKLLVAGGFLCVMFVLLRLINVYGDPHAFVAYEADVGKTIMSFLNLTKYPPSLLFLLMTIGPALILLRYAEHWHGKYSQTLITFGRVPFFFYVIHLYVLHFVHRMAGLFFGYDVYGKPSVDGMPGRFGTDSIAIIWLIALITLVIIYPAIKKMAKIKATNNHKLLSYL